MNPLMLAGPLMGMMGQKFGNQQNQQAQQAALGQGLNIDQQALQQALSGMGGYNNQAMQSLMQYMGANPNPATQWGQIQGPGQYGGGGVMMPGGPGLYGGTGAVAGFPPVPPGMGGGSIQGRPPDRDPRHGTLRGGGGDGMIQGRLPGGGLQGILGGGPRMQPPFAGFGPRPGPIMSPGGPGPMRPPIMRMPTAPGGGMQQGQLPGMGMPQGGMMQRPPISRGIMPA